MGWTDSEEQASLITKASPASYDTFSSNSGLLFYNPSDTGVSENTLYDVITQNRTPELVVSEHVTSRTFVTSHDDVTSPSDVTSCAERKGSDNLDVAESSSWLSSSWRKHRHGSYRPDHGRSTQITQVRVEDTAVYATISSV